MVTTIEAFNEELERSSSDVRLPIPPPGIIEAYKILSDKGFDVAPIAYIDKEQREVSYAVLERAVRPKYVDPGIQMYYPTPDGRTTDPLADILKKGRQTGRIYVSNSTKQIPVESRFGVSYTDVKGYVLRELRDALPSFSKDVFFRTPTRDEFVFAGKRYPHLGQADTSEWLFDHHISNVFAQYLGGDMRRGGVNGFETQHPSETCILFGFRLQALTDPQHLLR